MLHIYSCSCFLILLAFLSQLSYSMYMLIQAEANAGTDQRHIRAESDEDPCGGYVILFSYVIRSDFILFPPA